MASVGYTRQVQSHFLGQFSRHVQVCMFLEMASRHLTICVLKWKLQSLNCSSGAYAPATPKTKANCKADDGLMCSFRGNVRWPWSWAQTQKTDVIGSDAIACPVALNHSRFPFEFAWLRGRSPFWCRWIPHGLVKGFMFLEKKINCRIL